MSENLCCVNIYVCVNDQQSHLVPEKFRGKSEEEIAS